MLTAKKKNKSMLQNRGEYPYNVPFFFYFYFFFAKSYLLKISGDYNKHNLTPLKTPWIKKIFGIYKLKNIYYYQIMDFSC